MKELMRQNCSWYVYEHINEAGIFGSTGKYIAEDEKMYHYRKGVIEEEL
jgi:hypothetical protein